MGIGKEAIQYAIVVSQQVKELSGVVFLTLDCYEHRLSYDGSFNLYVIPETCLEETKEGLRASQVSL